MKPRSNMDSWIGNFCHCQCTNHCTTATDHYALWCPWNPRMIGAHTVITPTLVFLPKSTLSHINLAVPQSFLLSIGISPLPACTLNKSAFEITNDCSWLVQFFIDFLSLCTFARLSASCIASHCIMTCFFVVVVHFSLVTTLFCFISLDTLLATFLYLYWVFMSVFSCVSLHLGKACCIVSHCDLFLCCCCCCCWFLTHHNSLLFYFIRFIIGNFFVVVLSVYVCVYLHLSGIFARLSASCHIVTCFFVDVVDFSLMTTLFVLFH